MREILNYGKNEDRQINDFYATPPEEVRSILSKEKLYGNILENSCGQGHIAREVKDEYPDNKLITTDLIDRGYGEGGLDFLASDYPYTEDIDTIIMNPPFKHIESFVNKSLSIAKKKVILFARMQFLESQTRYESIFKHHKPNRIYIYVDRVACYVNGDFNKKHSSTMAFAWFVWDKKDTDVSINWIRRYDKS